MRLSIFQFKSLVFGVLIIIGHLSATSAQVRAIYDNGANGLGQRLKRLQTTASAMHTGAHPDDEDSGLIAYLARKEQARTSYLSLNRGEGGQNIIGTELFEPLGVIRTEELLQARRLDGGQQFFTRVMDYGFQKPAPKQPGFGVNKSCWAIWCAPFVCFARSSLCRVFRELRRTVTDIISLPVI